MGRSGTEPGGAVVFQGLGLEGTPWKEGLQSPQVLYTQGSDVLRELPALMVL